MTPAPRLGVNRLKASPEFGIVGAGLKSVIEPRVDITWF